MNVSLRGVSLMVDYIDDSFVLSTFTSHTPFTVKARSQYDENHHQMHHFNLSLLSIVTMHIIHCTTKRKRTRSNHNLQREACGRPSLSKDTTFVGTTIRFANIHSSRYDVSLGSVAAVSIRWSAVIGRSRE